MGATIYNEPTTTEPPPSVWKVWFFIFLIIRSQVIQVDSVYKKK